MIVGRHDGSLNVTVNVVVLPSVSEHDAGTAAFGRGGVLSTTMGTTSAPLYPSSVEYTVLAKVVPAVSRTPLTSSCNVPSGRLATASPEHVIVHVTALADPAGEGASAHSALGNATAADPSQYSTVGRIMGPSASTVMVATHPGPYRFVVELRRHDVNPRTVINP